jgi:nitric oxide reductase large subunit
MKNFLIGLVLLASLVLAPAAQHKSYSFISPQAKAFIVLGAYSWTNLNASGLSTNFGSLRYTNYNNVSVSTVANSNTFNIFSDVPNIAPYEAWPFSTKAHAVTASTNENAKANTAIAITYKALYGTDPIIVRVGARIHDDAAATTPVTDIYSFSVTPSTTLTTTYTNLPMGLFGPCKSIRILDVTTTVATSSNVVSDLRLVGWEP